MHVNPAFAEAIQQALYFSLCLGLALSSLWGMWLLLQPESARRFARGADRWVSTDPWFDRLNQPVSTNRFFYRHHRAAGSLISLGSLYALSQWLWSYDRARAAETLFRKWVSAGLDWLILAGESLFVGFNLLFLVVGIVIIFRPSLLKVPETVANRWVDVPAEQVFDRKFDPLNASLEKHPRVLGGLIAAVCGALFLLLTL